MILSGSLTQTPQPGHQAPALIFHSVHNLLRNSPFGEQANIASYLLSRAHLESGAVKSTRPYCLSPFLSSRSFAFTPRYDDAVLVTNASLHQVPP